MIGELEGKPAAGGLEMEDRGPVSSDPGGAEQTPGEPVQVMVLMRVFWHKGILVIGSQGKP